MKEENEDRNLQNGETPSWEATHYFRVNRAERSLDFLSRSKNVIAHYSVEAWNDNIMAFSSRCKKI
jgi:broad specificity phosphatase PhoE